MFAKFRPHLARAAAPILVGVLPVLLLMGGIARFMLDHFFVHAPYLLDTGMLSALSYRDGVLLDAPPIALNYVHSYYDVYFSPLTSLFSVASYVVPIGRIEWYVLIQALVYAPIAGGVYLVASRLEPSSARRRLPITTVAALAFAFSGMVLWMVGYPHFEAAMPGFTCLMLAALVTGRTRWAWVWLVLAACVRQDGGIHIATALAPVLFLAWRRREMVPARRTLIVMMASAIAMSVAGMLAIKIFFTPFPRLAAAYLGSPLYSHLSMELLSARAHAFLATNQVIYYPFLATCLIAVLRRDPGYLLGWISTVPWFLFCFLAVEDSKASFFAYGVGPFMIGMFWCYLYGAHLAPAPRRLRAGALEAVFVLVCLSSTLGVYRAAPVAIRDIAHDMWHGVSRDRGAVHAFVDAIHDQRARFGHIQVDYGVAALAIENLAPDAVFPTAASGVDTIMYHRDEDYAGIVGYAIANDFDYCARIRHTGIIVCTHDRLPADTLPDADVFPGVLAKMTWSRRFADAATYEERGLVLHKPLEITGWLGQLPAGTYEWTVALAPEQPIQLEGAELVALAIVQGDKQLATTAVPPGASELRLRFEANGDEPPLAYQLRSNATSTLVVPRMQLRKIAAPAPVPAVVSPRR